MGGKELPRRRVVDWDDEVVGTGLVLEVLPAPAVYAQKRQKAPICRDTSGSIALA
jgi:hypothetical protein